MIKDLNNNDKGFTLVELMAVMVIIAVLSLVLLPNYQLFRKELALERSALKLVQDIRRAEEMAIAAKSCSVCGGEVPSGGYGVYIDKNFPDKYYIYADTSSPFGKYNSADKIVETINMEEGIYFSSLIPSSAKYSVNFRAPDPIVNIKDQAGSDKSNVTIILAIIGYASKNRTVNVNKAGLITRQ